LHKNKKEAEVFVFPLPLRTLSEGISLFVEKENNNVMICSLRYDSKDYKKDFEFVNYIFLNNVCSVISLSR